MTENSERRAPSKRRARPLRDETLTITGEPVWKVRDELDNLYRQLLGQWFAASPFFRAQTATPQPDDQH